MTQESLDNTANKNGDSKPLRRGWTTGACATAAAAAAYEALLTGHFPDPVIIILPKGQDVGFTLSYEGFTPESAVAGVIKDAGDDPDITHGATIISHVQKAAPNTGIQFRAGEGVGIVTKPGLPLEVGEPAINPVPRQMMCSAIEDIAKRYDQPPDVIITISVPGGAEMAKKTWNPQLGIKGGLSILGTTGIVKPFSCSAWIHSIHRGIDVARASHTHTIVAATGSTSQKAALDHFNLPDDCVIDMGDFVGGLLKYLRTHPLPHVIIAGGIGKMTKLACGAMDLHSGRSTVDTNWLASHLNGMGAPAEIIHAAQTAASASHVLAIAPDFALQLGTVVAQKAQEKCKEFLDIHQKYNHKSLIEVSTVVINRTGDILGEANAPLPPQNSSV